MEMLEESKALEERRDATQEVSGLAIGLIFVGRLREWGGHFCCLLSLEARSSLAALARHLGRAAKAVWGGISPAGVASFLHSPLTHLTPLHEKKEIATRALPIQKALELAAAMIDNQRRLST